MITVLGIVAPVFGIIVLGFVAARLRMLDPAAVIGLVVFVFHFAIPAMLFHNLARAELPAHIEWSFLVSYYGAALVVYALGMAIGRYSFRRPLAIQATCGMAAGFSNTVLLGIPLLLTVLGPEAALAIFLLLLPHSAVLMTLTMVLIRLGRGREVSVGAQLRVVVGELIRNPIILALVAGLSANLSGLVLPGPLATVVQMLGAAAVPCALFAMGASLAAYPLAGDVLSTLPLVLLKLLVHPLLVWVLAVPVLGLDGVWVPVAVLMATMPTGINVYLVATRYDGGTGVAARTIFLSTAISVITISTALYLFRS
ncbi:MAG TPA: AEC family transporter [Acidobacteriota bacterium]|nr:AEC family transporter [Acidobacteriota bacterium]